MKLLLDQNLSYKLADLLAQNFPGSSQVRLLGLDRSTDRKVYDHAALNDFTILSKDRDFHDLCLRFGPPPKVIWLNMGNCTTADVFAQIDGYAKEIHGFAADPSTSILVIGPHPRIGGQSAAP